MQKTVLIILAKGGGHHPNKMLVEYLKKEKFKIVLARKANDGLNEFDTYSDYIIDVDTENVNKLITEVIKFNLTNKIDSIVTVNEYVVEQTAMLCKVMGVNGLNVDAAKICRNKYLTRVCLSSLGIRQPRFKLIKSDEDLTNIEDDFKYPFIIKPLNFAGSCGVMKIDNKKKLDSVKEKLILLKKTFASNNHFVDSMEEYWIAEEYLNGFEITVECIANESEIIIAAIHDKMVSIDENNFLEQYAVTPSPRISRELENIIINESKKILRAVNFNIGVAHLEFRVGEEGPLLLEINARIGGILISASVLNSTGVNLAEALVKVSLGEDLNYIITRRTPTIFCTIFTGIGHVKAINGIDKATQIDGLVSMDIWIKEGDYVGDIMDGYGIVLMYQANTPEEAFLKAKQSVELIKYEMV